MTDYQAAIDWLYQLDAKRGMDFRLERLEPVLERLGDPHHAFPCVHVAGTNGKGSTAAMLHSVYRESGYRTGLYTSPHLLSFRERIRTDNELIAETQVLGWLKEIRSAMDAEAVALTFFEIATVMAFLQFRASNLDLAIVEVGLGGRLDATNVIDGVCAVITSIGYDHCAYLGNSLDEIAREKAGILRASAPAVTGRIPDEAERAIAEVVTRLGVRWFRYGREYAVCETRRCNAVPLLGAHQRRNAAVVGAVVDALRHEFPVEEERLIRGIARTRWPGRLEVLASEPLVLVDCAHNPEAAGSLREALATMQLSAPRVLVFGAMRDKDWRTMLDELAPVFDRVVLVRVAVARSFDPDHARPALRGTIDCEVTGSAHEGLARARACARRDGTIVVAGSIFLVAELYAACGGDENLFTSAART